MTTIEIDDADYERIKDAAEMTDEPIYCVVSWLIEDSLDDILKRMFPYGYNPYQE